MVFKFLAEMAARRDEAAAQAQAQSLVTAIQAFATHPDIPSSEDFVQSVVDAYIKSHT